MAGGDIHGSTNIDEIIRCILNTYDDLPSKFKPVQTAKTKEWVPLSGIVLEKSECLSPAFRDDEQIVPSPAESVRFVCVSVCTGMKSLPKDKLPEAHGGVLHDSHAEVLAIRAFNTYLLQECARLASDSHKQSRYLRRRTEREISDSQPQPFTIYEDVKIHMYCSDIPCGDASMELIMENQIDATPWSNVTRAPSNNSLLGRGQFDQLGVVRRKPARPDAPVCLSKSCSDKLTMWQCISVLKGVVSTLIDPSNAYIHNLILPAKDYREHSCVRAFEHRLGNFSMSKTCEWLMGHSFRPFQVLTTNQKFRFSRDVLQKPYKPSNKSAVWTPYLQEVLVHGLVCGWKQTHPQACSMLARRKLWELVRDIRLQLIPVNSSTPPGSR